MSEENAVLMAAGLGTRMRPLTEKAAKPLVKIFGKPMIETVIVGTQQILFKAVKSRKLIHLTNLNN